VFTSAGELATAERAAGDRGDADVRSMTPTAGTWAARAGH